MNIPRRLQVAAGVVAATATLGAACGVVVAGLILTTRFGHFRPTLLEETLKLGSQTGALFGVLLGAPVTLALLRRVPLSRLAADASAAAIYGGLLGFTVSLAFPQPRPSVALMLAGSCVGFGVATVWLWSRYRDARRAAAPSASY